jgi:hypothetical protein
MQNQYVLRDVASPHFRPAVQETSDEALIGLIADGDKRAMQVLYARHNVRVYRFIVRLTGNQSLAEDLVSEVFLDVWRQAEASSPSRRSRPGCSRSPATRRSPRCVAGPTSIWTTTWRRPSKDTADNPRSWRTPRTATRSSRSV